MARLMKPLVRGGGYYPSNRWTPLVYRGGYTTANGGSDQPDPVEKTASGAIVHITDALASPVSALSVAIEPVQSGSGDPSPSNIRPISGWTQCKVTRTGKNLFPLGLTPSKRSGVTVSNIDGGYRFTAIASSKYLWARFMLLDASKFAGKTLTVKGKMIGSNAQASQISLHYRDENDALILNSTNAVTNGYGTVSLTIPDGARGNVSVALYLTSATTASFGWTAEWTELQLEIGPTATAYEPYAGETYTITFPTEAGTVYGGQLDVTQGKLTVDRAMVDLGTLSFAQSAIYSGRFFAPFPENKPPIPYNGSSESELPKLICSSYAAKLYTDIWAGGEAGISQFISGPIDNVGICDTRYSDAQSFMDSIGGQTLVYYLRTPFEVQLTPTEITTLLGTNNVWSDAGDSTLTYYADGNASTSEALGILLGGTYNNPGGADDVSDDEALGILLGGS